MQISKHRNPWPRRLVWIMIVAGGLGGAAFYFSVFPDRLPDWAARTSLGQEMQTTRVYKWQDATGAWHVSDEPPPAGVDYSVQDYNTDDNVLPLPPALRE